MHKLALIPIFTATLLSATPLPASGAPPEEQRASWMVDLQIDATGGKQESHFLVAVAVLAGSCSEVATLQGEVDYHVQVCDQSRDGSQPIFAFEVSRVQRAKTTISSQRFKAQARLATGKKLVIGRFAHGDGASVSVTAGLGTP